MVTKQLFGKVFAGREALWVALQAAFAAIPPAKVLKLYDSMPSRLAALKLARGGAHSLLSVLAVAAMWARHRQVVMLPSVASAWVHCLAVIGKAE